MPGGVVTEGSNIFLAVLALLPLVFLIFKRFKASSSSQPLPPGPPPLPLIGNAHQLGKKPHIALTELAEAYGPVISLKLGSQRLIVGSSAAAATEILKTYDRILSGRHRPHSLPVRNRETENRSLGWAPECDENWKYLRTICRTELFSGKAIESQACLREKKVMELVRMIRGMEGKVLNLGEVAFATVFNTLSNLLLSRDFIGLSGDGDQKEGEMKALVRQLMEIATAPNLSDLYPVLGGLDLQGIRKKATKLGKKISALWDSTIKERRDRKDIDVSQERDFLDALIADGFTTDQINQLIMELFSAGTDTSTSTIEWVMAELIRIPKSMVRVQEELAREIKQDVLKESELSRLPYLQACVRETLRLHPPAPLLLPHRAVNTCQVMNYTIPKNSQVMVNVWAIGRDPAIIWSWKENLSWPGNGCKTGLKIMPGGVVTEGSNILLAVLALLPLVFLIFKRFKASSFSQPLPPGPPPLPLIGNVHQLGKKPHIALTELAKAYGPIISLKLGSQHLIVGSSAAAATEILKTYDRILSGRHRPHSLPIKNRETENRSLGWAPECDENWKYLRTICRTEFFSGKAIESQVCLREKKVMELVRMIRGMEGKVLNIAEVAFATVVNTLSNLLLSRDFIGLSGDGDQKEGEMKGLMRQLMVVTTAPNISDIYPILGGLDLQGKRKKATKLGKKISSLWDSTIKERRDRKDIDVLQERDFLDALIADGFTTDQINQLILELFLAGTDTSTSTIERVMAELMRNPKSMIRVQEELAREIKQDVLKESELSRLPYLQACVRETLRLHPPAPLLLPHRAVDTCQVMNYTIPKNSQVMVNVWAIGRDPAIWDDPTVFKPERFLNSEVDFKGNDFEFLPFGAGRRICPGLPMAAKQVPLVVASLIHFFDWSLPLGEDPEKLDMSEKFGVTLQKEQPLLLVPKARM